MFVDIKHPETIGSPSRPLRQEGRPVLGFRNAGRRRAGRAPEIDDGHDGRGILLRGGGDDANNRFSGAAANADRKSPGRLSLDNSGANISRRHSGCDRLRGAAE